MKVYVFIKINEHPFEPDGQGVHKGDIVSVWPVVDDIGKKTLDYFMPVVMDITVPCGEKFTVVDGRKQWSCGQCKFNDPEQCDVIKYKQPIIKTETDRPVLVKNRRYSIDRTSFLDSGKEAVVTKKEKTEQDKASIINYAKNNERSVSIITDKVL